MTRESILPPVQSLLKRFSNLANNFRGSYCHIQSFLCWRWSQYFQPYSCTNKPFASHRYCWWLGRAENSLFFRQQSGGYCVFSCIFLHACHVSGWRENVHPTTFFLIFSLAIRGVWGGGAITSFGTCTHVMLRLMLICTILYHWVQRHERVFLRCSKLHHGVWVVRRRLTCTWGLPSLMCFARDVLHYVMGFGVVRFMLTCILDGDVCFYS